MRISHTAPLPYTRELTSRSQLTRCVPTVRYGRKNRHRRAILLRSPADYRDWLFTRPASGACDRWFGYRPVSTRTAPEVKDTSRRAAGHAGSPGEGDPEDPPRFQSSPNSALMAARE